MENEQNRQNKKNSFQSAHSFIVLLQHGRFSALSSQQKKKDHAGRSRSKNELEGPCRTVEKKKEKKEERKIGININIH